MPTMPTIIITAHLFLHAHHNHLPSCHLCTQALQFGGSGSNKEKEHTKGEVVHGTIQVLQFEAELYVLQFEAENNVSAAV